MKHIKNLHETEYGTEGEVYFSLFDKFIGLAIKKGATIQFAEQCADLLNNLNERIIAHLCRASELYCNDFLSQIGEPEIEFEDRLSVLGKIYPSELIVPKPNSEVTPVVKMELNCEWEKEHGMEWVIRHDRVYYVGAYEGCDPYGDFEDNDYWNYAWKAK